MHETEVSVIFKKNITITSRKNLDELIEESGVDWEHDYIYKYKNTDKSLYEGQWEVELVRTERKLRFNALKKISMENGFSGANIFHLLNLYISYDLTKFNPILAVNSRYLDDFEQTGCVILGKWEGKINLCVGNWRGNKINGYDIMRVRKIK